MAKTKNAAGLKVVTAEAQAVEKRFRELFDKANKRDRPGATAAAADLRTLMHKNAAENLWRRVQGPMAVAEAFALEHSSGMTPGVAECWRERLANMRRELAGEAPSEVESLLAQHASMCWLRLAEVELQYTSHLAKSHTFASGVYHEKRLTMAQRRFTKAVETLERVRMMKRRAAQAGAPAEAERRRA